jgi:hypothetical protein
MKGPNSENNLSQFGEVVRFQLGEVGRRLVGDIRSEENRVHYVECSLEERNNSLHVQYEIDYWRFKPTAELKAWHSLQDMWDAAPQGALIHYETTAQAINRMRMSQGEASIKNLRRRTLPRIRK